MTDESRTLRTRLSGSIANLDRLVSPLPTGCQKFLGTVVAPGSGVSLLADHYVSVYETSIDGPEVEGGPVAVTVDTSQKILGIVLGVAPVAGDRLVFTSHSGRWVARKRGSSGRIPVLGCCTAQGGQPAVLNLTVNSGSSAGWQPATLTYGPKPSDPALGHILAGVTCDPGWWSGPVTASSITHPYYYTMCGCGDITVLFWNASFGGSYTTGGGPDYGTFPTLGRSCSPFLWVGSIQTMDPSFGTDFDHASFTLSG